MSLDPAQPVTAWVMVTAAATAFTVGVPLLIGLLSYRRASKDGQEKDIAALVAPIIGVLIKIHNDEPYAHPIALSRYVTLDTFNNALAALRTEIGMLRSIIESNERLRREDVEMFRTDMGELKKNVALAVGEKVA